MSSIEFPTSFQTIYSINYAAIYWLPNANMLITLAARKAADTFFDAEWPYWSSQFQVQKWAGQQ